jgi:hypothetical protein
VTDPAVRQQAIDQLAAGMMSKSPGSDPEAVRASAEALVDAAIEVRGPDDSQPD